MTDKTENDSSEYTIEDVDKFVPFLDRFDNCKLCSSKMEYDILESLQNMKGVCEKSYDIGNRVMDGIDGLYKGCPNGSIFVGTLLANLMLRYEADD